MGTIEIFSARCAALQVKEGLMRREDRAKRVAIVVVEDDPAHSAYLTDALAVAVPEASVAVFDDLGAALHTLARACRAGTTPENKGFLLLDSHLLVEEKAAISDAMRRLRLLAPIMVVALVNPDDPETIEKALRAGADEVLARPIDPLMLAQLARPVVGLPVAA